MDIYTIFFEEAAWICYIIILKLLKLNEYINFLIMIFFRSLYDNFYDNHCFKFLRQK